MSLSTKKTIPFTQAGYDKLLAEQKRLTIELVAVKERVSVAREMGDLSENGAYHYGKFELGSISRQLRQVQYQLANAFIIKKPESSDRVAVGHTVTLFDGLKEISYLLVNKYESDPTQRKISVESPLGASLLGRKVKDEITVIIPVGEKKYTLMAIM